MFTQTDIDTYSFIRGSDLKKRETLWGTIYLNTTSGNVHVVERWLYNFTEAPGVTPWSDDEKTNFHYALSSTVTGTWDSQTPVGPSSDPTVQQFLNLIRKAANVRIGVSGSGALVQRFAGRGLDIDFDIVLTSSQPQWHVTLQKVPATSTARSNVNWDTRRIELHSLDNNSQTVQQVGPGAATSAGFIASSHEFGHTLLADDEYTVGAPQRSDLTSIMNIGTQVRPRHLSFITSQLNVMVPGCNFRAM